MEGITLSNLGGGAAAERFNDELEKVVENILDLNAEAKAKREVILRVVIKPDAERRMGSVDVYAMSKLAPPRVFATRAFFGKDGQRLLAFEDNPNQVTIEDFIDQPKQPVNLEARRAVENDNDQ
jgi:hypothetical protein